MERAVEDAVCHSLELVKAVCGQMGWEGGEAPVVVSPLRMDVACQQRAETSLGLALRLVDRSFGGTTLTPRMMHNMASVLLAANREGLTDGHTLVCAVYLVQRLQSHPEVKVTALTDLLSWKIYLFGVASTVLFDPTSFDEYFGELMATASALR